MTYTTLVSADLLARRVDNPNWIVFDCRHDLSNPGAGEAAYAGSHIPGARFLHLDRDLAAPLTGSNGRHPLPEPRRLAARLAASGMNRGVQAVAYDASGGMVAARLWWMLRWLGHENVALLDGGVQAWIQAGGALSADPPSCRSGNFSADAGAGVTPGPVDARFVQQNLGRVCLIDARAPDRFRGENETLDPLGGRIPGALNRFFLDNLAPDGRFKPPQELRAEFERVLGGGTARDVVHYCGSGVSACHNALAMQIAGFPAARLYPGSWSEWCADRTRPIERGAPAA